MRKLIEISVLSFILLIFAAFSYPQKTGDYLFIDKGEIEAIELDADTYQGYEWIVSATSDPTIVKYEGKEFEYGEKNTDLSVQKIKFKGLKKGKTTVTLQYIKQGEMVPKKTKTITIKVY